jgi:hypothetical protein
MKLDKPMLPFEALHRIVSPAARALAPLSDADAPPEHVFFLPSAVFGPFTDSASEEVRPRRTKRRVDTNVSFCDATEWVYIDTEDPESTPVLKSQPLREEVDGECDSPRASGMKSSLFFEKALGMATPKASHAVSIDFGSYEAVQSESASRTSPSCGVGLDPVTPKASLALPDGFGSHGTFEDLDESQFLMGDATPKSNTSSASFKFCESDSDDDEESSQSSDQASPVQHLLAAEKEPTHLMLQFGMPERWADSSSDDIELMASSDTISTCDPDAMPGTPMIGVCKAIAGQGEKFQAGEATHHVAS